MLGGLWSIRQMQGQLSSGYWKKKEGEFLELS